ncbi:hypothetical protein DH2020_011362 [Rehmannia glutinosa]|uniref:Sodium/calcium exchanger membrane region domain-containing protein n=1 Tax=Rehmannia glutinosa TaxID=99300 RepID=A0ABR0XD74_REHGL
MGSLAGKSTPELEDVHLVNPQPVGRKTSSLEITPQRSFFGPGSEDFGCKCILSSTFRSIKIALFSNKLNLLVPCGPLAILVDKLTNHHLAFFTGSTVGGLLNATFGNATELIISMHALKSGMIRVVQQSLLGSILSNMLLVLGCALFGGGIVHFKREQVFNKPSAAMNSGLLLMAVMGLLFPAVLHFTHTELHFGKSELALSRFSSCIMLEESQTDGCSDDNEEPDMSKWESIMWLFILTSLISVLSEYLVNAIEGASVAMNIPISFISVIMLPIVGNAAEHAGAIMFAVKDKLIPFTVVVGWVMGRPMDLNFQLFETATLIMTVLVVAFMLQEGTSNYFKGLMLLLCYLIVAASFFVHIDPESVRE